ncbi:MAG: hypothetical protein U0165_14885 [Polyangiaceae bacterium]
MTDPTTSSANPSASNAANDVAQSPTRPLSTPIRPSKIAVFFWIFIVFGTAWTMVKRWRRFEQRHFAVPSVTEMAYPTCADHSDEQPAQLVSSQKMRSGPEEIRGLIVETFKIERKGCLTIATTRQEFSEQISDVEVVYDENLVPLRAWRRWTLPGSKREDGSADIKRYEFRTPFVQTKHRNPEDALDYEELRGTKPKVIIGPGVGLLTMWVKRAKLQPGQKVRERVVNIRTPIEDVHDVTLQRHEDTFLADIQRKVRVYSIYGRESFYLDENDNIVGDLAGLRPSDLLTTPVPSPLPTFTPLDPIGSP